MSSRAKNSSKRQGTSDSLKKSSDDVSSEAQVWIELDVKPSKPICKTNDVHQKTVLIHPTDAAAVDIRDGEPALLIASESGDDSIQKSNSLKAVICKVRVSSTEFTSPRKKKEGNVPEGEVHVMSTFISQRLMSEVQLPQTLDLCKTPDKCTASAASTTSTSNKSGFSFAKGGGGDALITPPQKSTPSKSGFSFAKGGGGDVLISPPQKSTPSKSGFSFAKGGGGDTFISPQKHSTPSSTKKVVTKSTVQKCILVPLHNLSRNQLGRFCIDAEELLLSPISTPSEESQTNSVTSTGMKNYLLASQRIIQTLIASKYQGSYISVRSSSAANAKREECEMVSIVFRGQIESFHIVDAIPQQPRQFDQIDVLSQEVANLNVSKSVADTGAADNLTKQTVHLDEMLRKWLKKIDHNAEQYGFRITSRTQIRFIDENEESGNTDNGISGTNSTHLCAGLDGTLSRIRDALLPPILNPELFPANGPLRPPKGVLLHGPAGVGKSLVAAQIAHELSSNSVTKTSKKIHVRHIQCADLLAMTAIVGEAESVLSGIFEEAERKTNEMGGSLIVLDDVHLICPRRGGIGSGGGGLGVDQLAGTLLALLDGIGISKTSSPQSGLVVLAITTDPSLLDPALRRSGRLDSEIEVPVPDDKAREEILRFHVAQLATGGQNGNIESPIGNDQLRALARLAKGFTGADCKLAVKEAVRCGTKRCSNDHDKSGVSVSYADIEHGIRTTKPSAIKSVAVEVPHVPWSSIGGMDRVKSLLRESIELPLTHPHLFEMMKVPPPKGILLYGPPGCSKTLMARAIATEGQMNFLAVKGPELLSKWLGESERALASLFRRARLASPSVVFFDEVDAIAGKRGEGGGGGGDRLLSQLLTELDGVTNGAEAPGKKPCRVVVVGATNRPDTLDPALTRPGRMDRMIYVGLPDSDGRKSIFEIGLRGKSCNDDVDVSYPFHHAFAHFHIM